MAQYIKHWQCDTCNGYSDNEPWTCPGCGKETCDRCFDRFAHCRSCSVGKSEEELRLAANEAGYEFDAPQENDAGECCTSGTERVNPNEHDLTSVELLQGLTDLIQSRLKYMLRAERHPDDPSREADLE